MLRSAQAETVKYYILLNGELTDYISREVSSSVLATDLAELGKSKHFVYLEWYIRIKKRYFWEKS